MSSASPSPLFSSRCAIIGGGPAGLMAAEQLARTGIKVTLYEQMPTIGRKLLMAGRGGLNLTHSESFENLVTRYSKALPWLRPALEAFTPLHLVEWVNSLGQETFVGSSGRIFPKSLKSSPLLRAWLRRLESLGVTFALRYQWCGWDQKGDLLFKDPEGQFISAQTDVTVLALGGASWPRLGSDGHWSKILEAENIPLASLRAANCGFRVPWSKVFSERFEGQPLKPIKLTFADKTVQGEALVTLEGLEGGSIYTLSQSLRESIEDKGYALISVDLRPGLSIEEISDRLQTPRRSQSTTTYLRKSVNLSPIAIGLMRESVANATLPSDAQILARLIKDTQIKLTSTAPISRAISTAGGIQKEALNPYFMLTKKPGVFAIGEMLDWEAPTGGYLLQACFSTAVWACKGIQEYLKS